MKYLKSCAAAALALPLFATPAFAADRIDAEMGLEIEAFSLMCVMSYIGDITKQGLTPDDLPKEHPLLFWGKISNDGADFIKRDWMADFSLIVEYNLARRKLLGDDYIDAEDVKTIEGCVKVQTAFEADEKASPKK